MKGKVNSRQINYSREVKGFRSFLDQNIPLVFPGQSQSVGEEPPIGSPLPSSTTLESEDLFLTEKVELNPTTSGPDVVIDSGDSSPRSPSPVEDLVRLASLHLQSLIKERAICEEVLTRQIPGLSSRSSEVKGEQVEQVKQLLEDAREEQERILSLAEKAELLAGVTQSRRLRQGLETWREDIRELDLATTNNQDVTAIINKMIRTIRTISTLVWSLASTSTWTSY